MERVPPRASVGRRLRRDVAHHSFHTKLDAEHYFQGLARQEVDFHAAVGELVDNAFSARKRAEVGEELQPITVEITLEQQEGEGTVIVQVADHGLGMTLEDLTTRVFNPGGQGTHHGSLNEHGFGLKNALALLTGGNSTYFELYTRSADDADLSPDQFLHVTGPLSVDMAVDDDASREQWATDLHILNSAPTGTKIRAVVQWKYFRSVYKRGTAGFDVLATRLGEHLGVMHRYFISQGNTIKLSYRRAGQDWNHQTVPAIDIPYLGERKTVERALTVGGVEHKFSYTHGVLDYAVKDAEAESERGWPYPLRSYYQGSNARCGVDIVVRDRVIKSGVFEEIWPDIGKTVDFNRFVGELRVGADFRTTNNKTGLDPHADNWEQLLLRLGETDGEFRPEKTTRSQSETSLRETLIKILGGTFPVAKISKERGVWAGGVEIDILLDAGPDNIRLYELKVTDARILDVYQLLAGWDGLVKEGIHPTRGILVCKQFSQAVSEAATAAKSRKDAADNEYDIEVRLIDELVPST
jgi:hypothetical protein